MPASVALGTTRRAAARSPAFRGSVGKGGNGGGGGRRCLGRPLRGLDCIAAAAAAAVAHRTYVPPGT